MPVTQFGRYGFVMCFERIGVSPNIIYASFEALLDSINYRLMKDNAQAA
jgi:hypothetical protein